MEKILQRNVRVQHATPIRSRTRTRARTANQAWFVSKARGHKTEVMSESRDNTATRSSFVAISGVSGKLDHDQCCLGGTQNFEPSIAPHVAQEKTHSTSIPQSTSGGRMICCKEGRLGKVHDQEFLIPQKKHSYGKCADAENMEPSVGGSRTVPDLDIFCNIGDTFSSDSSLSTLTAHSHESDNAIQHRNGAHANFIQYPEECIF